MFSCILIVSLEKDMPQCAAELLYWEEVRAGISQLAPVASR